jgi:3-phenylpropionate/trans-cinnamate dioxygenase ferredoxin component
MALVRLCGTAEVPSGEARRFALGEGHVAVANLGAGTFRALDAVCSHEHAWLDEGELDVEDRTLECPKHGSVFDLDTGAAKTLPAVRPVAAYPLTIHDDDILIEV